MAIASIVTTTRREKENKGTALKFLGGIARWRGVWPQKKRGSRCFTSDSLLGGGYLRLPMPLTVGAGTLRALCQEREQAVTSRYDRHLLFKSLGGFAPWRGARAQKNEGAAVLTVTPS